MMSMQATGDGSRPTFFEMSAAQHLPASLRSALHYSLGVMAQRRPILHKVLDHYDEIYSLLMLVLEAHSLRTTDASFAEALYGLRRRPLEFSSKENKQDASKACLSRRQRVLSLLFLVGLPYLKTKLQTAYNDRRGGMLQAALWGRADSDDENLVLENVDSEASEITIVNEQNVSWIKSLKKKLCNIAVRIYPWIHASHEGISFAYQLLYLLDAIKPYTPALQMARIQVCRASGQELMNASSLIAERRNNEFERLQGPPIVRAFQRGMLQTLYATLDYAQTSLIAAVFVFKMLEWWYQSGEERVMAPSIYPPPPPPPAPKVAEKGIPLPPDRRLCPLCLQIRTNPAVVAVSGFVFCYPCIFKYTTQYNRCPITLMAATVDHIRRLYHDA